MVNKLEVSRDIEAAPSEVYAALSDVTQMGELLQGALLLELACKVFHAADCGCHLRRTQPLRRSRVDHSRQRHQRPTRGRAFCV